MTKKEALIKTIYNLENDVYEYAWGSCDSCSCGVIARTLLDGGMPTETLFVLKPHIGIASGFSGTYEDGVNYCRSTGIPLPKVFQALVDADFSFDEMNSLEECYSKEDAIAYMKKLLKQEEETTTQPVQSEQPKVIEKTVYVSVPTSITEQSKELILS